MIVICLLSSVISFCCCAAVLITQWPKHVLVKPGATQELSCYQNQTDYDEWYWYWQIKENEMKLMVYYYGSANYENEFQDKVFLSKETKKSTLEVRNLNTSNSGVYFCAARMGGSNTSPLIFGKGTKLTVLEKNVTEPTLEILSPSQDELCKRNRVTLICLTTDFYPDHITITWDLPQLNEPTRIKTDTPVLNGHTKLYGVSSRLRVPKSVWCNPDNKFTCIVTFGMENGTETYRRSIHGSQDCVKRTESVKKNSKTVTFAYLIFIGKSVLYGFLLTIVLWKTKLHSKDFQ